MNRKVVVAIRMAGMPGRRKFQGVLQYLEEKLRTWDLRFIRAERDFTSVFVRRLEAQRVDGIIVSMPAAEEACAELGRLCIPTVVVDVMDNRQLLKRRRNIAFLKTNARAIGRVGAECLLAQGRFRMFGYVGDCDSSVWSRGRAFSFSGEIKAAGFACDRFEKAGLPPDEDRQSLVAWLLSLKKPAGIMVAFDDRALQVLEACREAGLSVPDDVAIVSCDNDDMLCAHLSPSLTSIEPNHVQIGYRAAQLLDEFMQGRTSTVPVIESGGISRLVSRESTAVSTPGGALVRRANDFIAGNALSGIGVQDVVNYLKVSRRLADLRFREIQGMSILDAIRQRQFDEVCRLLRQTNDTMESIALRCGFADGKYLMAAFKRQFGISMGVYRREKGPA